MVMYKDACCGFLLTLSAWLKIFRCQVGSPGDECDGLRESASCRGYASNISKSLEDHCGHTPGK